MQIVSITWVSGEQWLLSLKPNFKRSYRASTMVNYTIETRDKIIKILLRPGFEFDGRSGTRLIDWLYPNLGSSYERTAYLTHDALSYGAVPFEECNAIFEALLLLKPGYPRWKAALARKAVSMSSSWYGPPKEGTRYYPNLSLMDVRVFPKRY